MRLWGLSPVLACECVQVARRWQTFAARLACLMALLASLIVAWIIRGGHLSRRNELAAIAEAFFIALTGTQLVLVLLAAPAYLAGSICLDKARGNLTHMLVTDLSATEIVLGKLAARGLPVLGLLLAGVPVLALASLLGGIEPEAIIAGFAVSVAAGLVGCTLALLLSVWARKPHEVLLATYLIEGIWLLAMPVWRWVNIGWPIGPPPDWLEYSNPFMLAFAAYAGPLRAELGDYLLFFGVCLGLSAIATCMAVLTLRPGAQRTEVRTPRRRGTRRRWLPGPSLDFNPVLWREWRRPLGSRWLWAVWSIYTVLSLAAMLAAVAASDRRMAAFVGGFQFSIGLLLTGVTAVASLFEERVRGSLDVLLTTPLPTSTIVRGKWWGGFRLVGQIALLPIVLAFALAMQRGIDDHFLSEFPLLVGLTLAYGAMVNSLALALATWVRHFAVAMGCMVALYVVLAAGPVLLLLVTRTGGGPLEGFASLSPWYGVGETIYLVGGTESDRHLGWKCFWLGTYTCTALLLWVAIERTFNRCLGRAGR